MANANDRLPRNRALVPVGQPVRSGGATLSGPDADILRANRGAPGATVQLRRPAPPVAAPAPATPYSVGQRAGATVRAAQPALSRTARLGASPVTPRAGAGALNVRAAPGQGVARGAVLAGAALGGAAQAAQTGTDTYRNRLMMEPGGSFGADLGIRAVGAMSDVGGAIIDAAAVPVNLVRGLAGKPALSYRDRLTRMDGQPAPSAQPQVPAQPVQQPAAAAPGAQPQAGTRLGSFTVEQSDPSRPAAVGQPAPAGMNSTAPGTAVFNNRTVPPAEIAALANRNVVPAVGFSRPAPGVANSVVTGGATPELGAGPGLRRPQARPNGGLVGHTRDELNTMVAQNQAARNVQAALSGAPGTPYGDAGRAAKLLLQHGTASERAAARAGMAELLGTGTAGVELGASARGTAAQEAGATDRAGMDAEATLAAQELANQGSANVAQLTRPQGQQVIQADGTVALVRPDGAASMATLPDGTPVRALQQPNQAQARSRDAALGRVSATTQKLLEQAQLSGAPADPTQFRQLRLQALELEGVPMIENAEGQVMFDLGNGWEPL